MTDLTKLARPYAKAAFEFAQEEEKLDQWSLFLDTLSIILKYPRVEEILKNPKYTDEDRYNVCVDLSANVLKDEASRNFIGLLAKSHRLNIVSEINQEYKQLHANAEKIVNVCVESAENLSASYQKNLNAMLSKKLNQQVVVDYKVNPELLCGLLIKLKDKVVDTTVRSQLNRLREALI